METLRLPARSLVCTTWPVVTLVKRPFVNSVGTIVRLVTTALNEYVPPRMWYCSKAVNKPALEVRPWSVALERLLKAAFEGARMVILAALVSDSRSCGIKERTAPNEVNSLVAFKASARLRSVCVAIFETNFMRDEPDEGF